MPALKPYWGKPAVRNFRGDDGNGGIIRSPQRAIVLPDCGGRGVILVPTATLARAVCNSRTVNLSCGAAHMSRRRRPPGPSAYRIVLAEATPWRCVPMGKP